MFKSKAKPAHDTRPISFFPSMRKLFDTESLSSLLALNSNTDPLSELAPMDDETARLKKVIDFQVGAGPTADYDSDNFKFSNVAEEVEEEIVQLQPPPLTLSRPRPITNMMFDRSVDSHPELKKPTSLSSRFSSTTFADDDDKYDFSDAFKTQSSHPLATYKLQKRVGLNGKVEMNYLSAWRVVWHGYSAAVEMAAKRDVEMRRVNNRLWSPKLASRSAAQSGFVAAVSSWGESLKRGEIPSRNRMSSANQATTTIDSEASPFHSHSNSILHPRQPIPSITIIRTPSTALDKNKPLPLSLNQARELIMNVPVKRASRSFSTKSMRSTKEEKAAKHTTLWAAVTEGTGL